MPEWCWHAGEVSGRCPHCQLPLFPMQMIVDFRGTPYHVECVIEIAATFAPKPYPTWMPS